MNNNYNPPTEAQTLKTLKKLDLQWNDTLILHDGRVVQVVEEFDGIVKVTYQGAQAYVRRDQIKAHYPYIASGDKKVKR